MIRAALLLLMVGTQAGDFPISRVRESGARVRGREAPNQLAYFEAFPASGAGTGGVACSTTPPTGAKGETLTFTRASAATCTKTAAGGLATTGIADGDLVSLSTNVARVEYDSNGVLGLLVEAARTNTVLRSEEMDNASWGSSGSPAAGVWPNDAGAPDGTQTADALHFAAIGDTGESVKYQLGIGSTTSTCSTYLKAATPMDGGVAVAGSIDMAVTITAGTCTTCSYVADSWTRCVLPNVAIGGYIWLGNEGAAGCSAGAKSSRDVLVWGTQCEVGAYATSYIPTTTIAVARAAEPVPYFSPTLGAFATGCMGVSVESAAQPVANSGGMSLDEAGTFDTMLHLTPTTANLYVNGVSRVTSTVTPPLNLTPSINRLLGSWGAATTITVNGTATAAGAFAPSGTLARVYIGGYNGGNAIGSAIHTRAILDPDPARCR